VATYDNVKAEDFLNIDTEVETEIDLKEIDEFIESRQQS
jgi:hypothetical protein